MNYSLINHFRSFTQFLVTLSYHTLAHVKAVGDDHMITIGLANIYLSAVGRAIVSNCPDKHRPVSRLLNRGDWQGVITPLAL